VILGYTGYRLHRLYRLQVTQVIQVTGYNKLQYTVYSIM